ncbi:Ankyrin repeat-containing protein BDA1 [Camellia lanceoleosa]|uniref:Ankyrin repeat-containing protein BDA1 n=1 Tax=Camellia lanceoleosa TaxID=1840588 RepID=A0ACC0IUP1_9ERIC|nr:Ankyrin repeat-containing protein BDA1 [Camellia lanceoleosa]
MSIISYLLESQSNSRSSAILLATRVMENQQVQQRLMEAAQAGDISLMYGCIQEYPKILDGIDETPFVDTPLHIAASARHAHFALEMMKLKPSFGGKLNPQGLSPLDLALRRRAKLSPKD